MAIGYNPTTVTEGLIYYIDPNNNRSYSGIGNTVYNLVNSGFGGTFVGLTTAPLDSTNTRTFYLNNSTNYINGPNNIALTNNFTVSVWFKIGVYNTGSIIGKWFWDGTSAHRCWIINTDVGGSMAIVLSSDGTFTNPTIKRYLVPVSLNEYTQITFTFASGTLLVYKNGVLATVTKNIDGTFSTVFNAPTRPIQIGYFFDFSAYYNLANVGVTQIYNRVLSPSEILQNYNATKKRYLPEEQIVTDGLILNLDPGNPRSYSGTGNTIYDLAGTGNSGNLLNGPVYSHLNGGYFTFDGANDTIRINNTMFGTLFSKATSYSCDLWMYINNTQYANVNGDNDIVEFSGNYPFVIRYENSGIKAAIYDGTNNPSSLTAFIRDRWVHYCLVVNYNNNLAYNYLNGVLVSTFSVAAITNNLSVTSLYLFSRNNSLNWVTGRLGTLHMYNKALSSQEVQQNYNATKNRFINVLPPVRDNLILELDAGNLSSYPGSGTTWFDLSGNNLNGALTNGPTYSFSDSASSIVFDGTNDFINLGTSIPNSFSSLTIETIIKIGITNKKQGIVSTYKSNLGWGLEILDNTFSNKFNFFGFTSSGVGTGVQSSSSAVLNQTYHLTAVYTNATSMTLYVNGVNNGSVITSYSSIQKDATANLQIGDDPETSQSVYYQGNVYTTKIYNRALSAAEIAQNFNFYRTRYGI
jgi:hypothetical protein